MSVDVPRPIDPSLHPLATGNYRIATPAIQAFYDLVIRCLHYRIMGALIYGPSRIGKTRAIEYVRLLLARNYPKMTSCHAQCEHKPRHAEGPFFANLLEAVGDPDPNAGSNPSKRMRLSLRIREAAARAGSGTVLLFCDEAQRYNENEYEWLRDVHDALDRQQDQAFHVTGWSAGASRTSFGSSPGRIRRRLTSRRACSALRSIRMRASRRGPTVDVRRLRPAFDLPRKTFHGSLIQISERSRCSDRLRRCRRCMGRGYHSVIHHHRPMTRKERIAICGKFYRLHFG